MTMTRGLLVAIATGLAVPASAAAATVDLLSVQKISDSSGYLSSPGSPGSNPGGLLADGDHFGSEATGIGDLDGDGVGDLAVGALTDDDGAVDAGALWILFRPGVVAHDRVPARARPGPRPRRRRGAALLAWAASRPSRTSARLIRSKEVPG